MSDHVELDLPLSARHASTARAVAASVAADVGLSIDQIDDLRLGVNEVVSVMADVDHDGEARLMVRFDALGDRVEVTVRRSGVDEVVSSGDLDVLATRILQAVVDEYSIDEDGVFTIVKIHAGDVDN